MTRETTSSDQNPALPEIHGYRLQRVLGYGGMSTVYLARQKSLDREVALKVMLPEALTDEISRRRFENEARTIARLDHPHVVGIYEVGRSHDGLPYYAMPYLQRGHLGQRGFVGDEPRIREVLDALLSALEYAHSRGVVHRDVKAENVLFDDTERPMLADFGIALRRGYGTRVTTAGLAVGSTAYMPPEQARGHNVDGRADLYSVGVVGWEMLTGKLPYNAGDALSMALQHAQEPIPRLPPELRHWQKFFDRALAKTPEERFATAKDMRAALERIPAQAPTRIFAGLAGKAGGLKQVAIVAGAAALIAGGAYLAMRLTTAGGERLPGGASTATASADPQGFPAQDAPQAPDAVDALMRPLPESPAERLVVSAEAQLRNQRWISPAGDNAYESLLAAANADAMHPRLLATTDALVEALSGKAVAAIGEGNIASAVEATTRASGAADRIAAARGDRSGTTKAVAAMHARVRGALHEKIDGEVRAGRRDSAVRLARSARSLGIDASGGKALLAAARSEAPTATPGQPDLDGWTRIRGTTRAIAIADSQVSRGSYGRFADATGREGARCRERGSLLRIFSPRDWKSPGFEQSADQPVVCVSWQDAHAYAIWLGRQDGNRYRLARVAEAKAAPVAARRPVASWSDACGQDCSQRVATGTGWRGGETDRPLEGDRGYDDVGIRLVREL